MELIACHVFSRPTFSISPCSSLSSLFPLSRSFPALPPSSVPHPSVPSQLRYNHLHAVWQLTSPLPATHPDKNPASSAFNAAQCNPAHKLCHKVDLISSSAHNVVSCNWMSAAAVAVVATSGERTRRKGRRGVVCR